MLMLKEDEVRLDSGLSRHETHQAIPHYLNHKVLQPASKYKPGPAKTGEKRTGTLLSTHFVDFCCL